MESFKEYMEANLGGENEVIFGIDDDGGLLSRFLVFEPVGAPDGPATGVPGGSNIAIVYDGDQIGELNPPETSNWFRDSRTLTNGVAQIRVLDPEGTGAALFAATMPKIKEYMDEDENRFPSADYILNISPIG